MIPGLSGLTYAVFTLAFAAAVLLLNRMLLRAFGEGGRRKFILILVLEGGWLAFHGIGAVKHLYLGHLEKVPPLLFRFGLLPALVVLLGIFSSRAGRKLVDLLSLRDLVMVSLVRVPVEVALFGLYLGGAVPRLMTFEGGNPDILSGVTAAIVAVVAFPKVGPPRRKLLLFWNLACLALLVNIVTRALLSAPFPFQKLALEQPNTGILAFPFIWLPTFIVPVVLFSHLAAIRQLVFRPSSEAHA